MANGSLKNIEDIEVGDKLAYYDAKKELCILNSEENIVEEKGQRQFVASSKNPLVKVYDEKGKEILTSYTPNHRTFAKLTSDKTSYSICLFRDDNGNYMKYLSIDENINIPSWYQIFKEKEFDRVWILKTYRDLETALSEMVHIYNCFKIPSLENNNEKYEEELHASRKVEEKVDFNLSDIENCLKFYYKNPKYPLIDKNNYWTKAQEWKFGNIVEIYANNLDETNLKPLSHTENNEIKEISCKIICDDMICLKNVYSLKLSKETYVGDNIITHNCIYRFRGAVPQIMLDFENQFKGCKKVILNVNHRSEPEIVETTKRLIENNTIRFEKPLAAYKTGQGVITYSNFKNRDKEISQIVKEIKSKQRKGEKLDEIAILYRTNNQAAQITQAFIKADIPFYTNEMVINIYDHWIFNDIKNFKKVVDNTCNINEFLSLINRPNRYVARRNMPTVYNEEEIMKSVFLLKNSWQREKMRETLDDWFYWIDKMSEMTPYHFIECIRKNLEYDKYIKEYAETNKFDVSQFMDVIDEIQDNAQNFTNFNEWYEYIEDELKKFKEKMKEKKKEGSVALSTMHKAKGLEWNEVYIIDCNEDITPYYKAEMKEDMEEERRMFYVATTRARETLHICSIEKRNKTPMYLSRFVKEMKKEEDKKHSVDQNFKTATASIEFKPQMWVFHKTFGSGVIIRVDGDRIHIAFSDAGMKVLGTDWCINNLQLF